MGEEGRRIDLAATIAPLAGDAMAAVCGPLPMIDAARRAWSAAGRAASDIRFETFGSSGSRPPEAFMVRLAGTGRDIVVPESRSMPEALEAAGVEVMSDCRRGECGICALDVVSCDGEIDHRDVFFSHAQRHEASEGVRLSLARYGHRHDRHARQGRRTVESTGLSPDNERETRS